LSENSVRLSTGTKFSLIKVSKDRSKREIKLINGWNNNSFLVLMDEEDIDFQFRVDNKLSSRGISFSLNLDNYSDHTYSKPNGIYDLETLSSIGKKFHIRSEKTSDGKVLIAMSASKHGISFEKASINCSRITFKVEVEVKKPLISANIPLKERQRSSLIYLNGDKIQVFVRILSQRTITIDIGLNNTIEDLKKVIYEREGSPTDSFRLVWKGKQLQNSKTIAEYNIENDSTIHLVLSLNGGQKTSETSESSVGQKKVQKSDKDVEEEKIMVGERGVICFSDKSNQKFGDYNDFKRDSSYDLISFTVEFRMVSKYTPI
jgi:hypothetical protein